MTPFGPDAEGLFSPGAEGDCFDHGGCDDSDGYVSIELLCVKVISRRTLCQ